MDHHEDATHTRGSTKGAETCASEAVRGADEEGDEQVGKISEEQNRPGERIKRCVVACLTQRKDQSYSTGISCISR